MMKDPNGDKRKSGFWPSPLFLVIVIGIVLALLAAVLLPGMGR